MVQSVLGSLTLGYRLLWNPARKLAGVQLLVDGDGQTHVDAPHLLRTIREMWSASSPPLLLTPATPALLADLLEHAPAGTPSIEVDGAWLADAALLARAQAAHRRGLRLVWRGLLDALPEPAVARLFGMSVLQLSSRDAMQALQVAAQRGRSGAQPPPASPLIAGQVYDGVASRALLSHCLDDVGAMAVAGWPVEDVLHSLRYQPLQPSHETVLKLLKAIDEDQGIEALESVMGEDALLAYRFMTFTNSASLGLRTGVDTPRRGLVMMGYGALAQWLGELLPHASTEPDMRPVRDTTVLRARLAERLMDAGVSHDLRREVYLSGLFSRLDELLHEPIGTIMRRLPLSERIYNAVVLRSGAYAPCLEVAKALEGGDAALVRRLCEDHEMGAEHVNRSLLRMLAEVQIQRPPRAA